MTKKRLTTDEYLARGLLSMKKVETVCTTDVPADDLAYHARVYAEGRPGTPRGLSLQYVPRLPAG